MVGMVAGIGTSAYAQAAPDANSVLILGATVLPSPSLEEAKAAELGYTVVVDTDAEWLSRSAADFATFRAVIFGDRICALSASPYLDAALANRAVWSAAITGNIVVIGTDPMFHSSFHVGLSTWGDVVTKSGIAFAGAEDGKTGLYATLSCYYHETPPGTSVSVLDQFGSFTVTGSDQLGPLGVIHNCYNDAHIVAVHAALAGLTDASLSDWGCSVHEVFDSFPSDFLPLAIAEGIGCPSPPGGGLNFGDDTCGTPYILARGEELSPIACGNGTVETGEQCDDGNRTNGDGCSAQCTIVVPPGPVCGDGIVEGGEACDDGNTASGDGCSATCTVENSNPVCSAATASPTGLWPPNHQLVRVLITGATDPDGDPITIAATHITQDEPVTGSGQGAGKTLSDATLSPIAIRAERNGNPKTPGNGRVYHISFTADDGAGGSCSGVVQVCVPHDQRPGGTCIDGGPLYSSIP